ncbi:SO2930 family diheme c-type cytochrome [Leptospira harrisiae]|uniref:Cytochrome c domain-containing protein n=1 Tax=Leptospira harrisiae TaxID=2023189 RepID=A0A2N0AL17_9LEPT|nr:SO2930 family diheme c-type cytochrome [Leptospira harrisiae]PJZ84911.1 hypothetical protein CH364_01120 [Leptospira harrisiae]PKA08414.1 hypothetical protein CH366_01120 [Leptospira harrisiae]
MRFNLCIHYLLVLCLFSFCSKKANLNLNGEAVKIHESISQYKIFANIQKDHLSPIPNGFRYDLNTALFSDYAKKDRVIFLPDGTNMEYDSEKEFQLPIGSIISKTFSLPENFRTFSGQAGKRIETRLLIHQPKGWFAVSYVWNEENTDAFISYAGESIPVKFNNEKGEEDSFFYSVPSRNQCASCHQAYEGRTQTIVPIGIKARHLNKTYAFENTTENQLKLMEKKGLLTGLPVFGVSKLADAFDTNETIENRARAYLEINCAHCHQTRAAGGINSKLILSYDESEGSLFGVCKTPGSAGKGGGGLRYDVVPGHPEESILHYRMATKDPGAMMPQIGRALVHREGVQLIYDWIKDMPSKDCP